MTFNARRVVATLLLASIVLSCSAGDDDKSRSSNRGATPMTTRRDVPVPQITVLPRMATIDPDEWKEAWQTTRGNETGECVTVGSRRTYRSGDFISGNFQSFIERTSNPEEQGSKLFFIPLYPDDSRPTLRVSAVKLDGAPASTLSFEFPADSWTSKGWPFYATGTDLPPDPGTWRIIATTGRNQGCFDVSVPC